ncbi:uncharacterized protein ACRADG_000643 [Cochliomyia hominivorax]
MYFSLQMKRSLSTSSYLMLRRLNKRSNLGLGYQINAIEDVANVIQNDPEGFAGLESDLLNVHKSHMQHEFEVKRQREKVRQYIVKRKYFRNDPLTNLLTYAEKEQIRFLHSTDNEEWTVEKLAESFPADTQVISKILKSNWSPMSAKKIQKHDASVLKNWERFKNGEYSKEIRPELNEHLKKFVDRETKDSNNLQNSIKSFQKKPWHKPICNEFFTIIKSLRPNHYEAEKTSTLFLNVKTSKIMKKSLPHIEDTDTYLLGEIKNNKSITMGEFKAKHQHHLINTEDMSNTTLYEMAVQNLNNTTGTGKVNNENVSVTTSNSINLDYTDKFSSNEIVISENDRKRYGMSDIKRRIHIPRKFWRKGATFRVNDCYYDDDGELLYRVPGMVTK